MLVDKENGKRNSTQLTFLGQKEKNITSFGSNGKNVGLTLMVEYLSRVFNLLIYSVIFVGRIILFKLSESNISQKNQL